MSGSLTGALRPLLAIVLISALAACGGARYRPVSDTPVRVGPPYTVRGVTYTPARQPGYDVLGYATWYGSESGNRAANGERFRPGWITGAHKTLPLPSYVEVTALDTGRRILVRINDRGPFGESARVIDLSRGAAEALGVRGKGKAAVRVRLVEPPEKDRAALRKGKAAQELPPISPQTLANLQSQFERGVGPGVGRR
ncbi:septal ring lytic transglycosylase RlpA family protein [Novosphingobium sp. KA1]|uniref:septal ring lytic transglycosylase RlpA family protein n=1 Tax=Novosphingobium sp. (strain KA1) TaxID=164608 RepID=UPI001A8D656C|nr:septal ring lytic transglycosylase RlpA family protein [Novosphingobium sp. KA1]QSR15817.1 septal ring lytic transglycosylase RlpA family lipoprotein [Novosphingobium sp. KA1]